MKTLPLKQMLLARIAAKIEALPDARSAQGDQPGNSSTELPQLKPAHLALLNTAARTAVAIGG